MGSFALKTTALSAALLVMAGSANAGVILPFPPNAMFNQVSVAGNHLTFFDGAIPSGDTILLEVTFDISVPDNPGGYAYSLVYNPAAVPEPSSLCLLGVGAIGLLARRRRG